MMHTVAYVLWLAFRQFGRIQLLRIVKPAEEAARHGA